MVRSSGRKRERFLTNQVFLLDDAGLRHFMVEIVAFPSALADAGNTDTPPWSLAMLLISSMMTTVLPTSVRPNAPRPSHLSGRDKSSR